MKCSGLNYDLCFKLFARDNPNCRCGAPRETAYHYFFDCPLHNDSRDELINAVLQYTNCTLKTILFGDSKLSPEINRLIFDAVHNFIKSSNRFR